MNKALDYNGLLEDHSNKKRLKIQLGFPLWAEIKYDGNFVTVLVKDGTVSFLTSGGLTYKHTDGGENMFINLPEGAYECERISGEGKLGDRVRCNLHGPKSAQLSTGHHYKIFDWIPLEDWHAGETILEYTTRKTVLTEVTYSVPAREIHTTEELEEYLKFVVNAGYEGLMLKQPYWKWRKTKSRTIDLCKYKKRRTADLRCIGTTPGEGKYVGKLGSVVLQDSMGRIVCVGSGLTDTERCIREDYYVGKIIEIEYEQIIDTYIQPTFIQVRGDKDESD